MSDPLIGRTLVIASGHDLSLALLENGQVLAAHDQPMVKGHAEALVPAIAALLAPFGGAGCGCNRVVIEVGPGSFTGLRVGLAAATALSVAWKAELRGVRSTQLVAADVRAAGHDQPLLVALAAPRGQVWSESFEAGALSGALAGLSMTPAQAQDAATRAVSQQMLVAGSAAHLVSAPDLQLVPRAAAAVYLGAGDLVVPEPVYVSAPEAA